MVSARPRHVRRLHRQRYRHHASAVGSRLPMALPLHHHRLRQPHRPTEADRPPKTATASGFTAPNNLPSAHAPVASCVGCAWAAGATNPARVTGTTSARSLTPTSTTTPTTPPSSSHSHTMLIDMHMLLAPFVLTLQTHTDMGDERGIRLRCICLGDAALRGSRMSARGRCGKGSASRIARSSLSIAHSSVCCGLF